jgi:hypothetical protein
MKKLIINAENPNGIEVELTAEEETARQIETTNDTAEATARENAKTQKAIDQANGNTKLLGLGLTQAEATALTGYTPPVAE